MLTLSHLLVHKRALKTFTSPNLILQVHRTIIMTLRVPARRLILHLLLVRAVRRSHTNILFRLIIQVLAGRLPLICHILNVQVASHSLQSNGRAVWRLSSEWDG